MIYKCISSSWYIGATNEEDFKSRIKKIKRFKRGYTKERHWTNDLKQINFLGNIITVLIISFNNWFNIYLLLFFIISWIFFQTIFIVILWCLWCNGYRHRKWTRWHEFKSWTRLIAFHIALMLLGKVCIQLFSLQLWVNSRADKVLQPWWGN